MSCSLGLRYSQRNLPGREKASTPDDDWIALPLLSSTFWVNAERADWVCFTNALSFSMLPANAGTASSSAASNTRTLIQSPLPASPTSDFRSLMSLFLDRRQHFAVAVGLHAGHQAGVLHR